MVGTSLDHCNGGSTCVSELVDMEFEPDHTAFRFDRECLAANLGGGIEITGKYAQAIA